MLQLRFKNIKYLIIIFIINCNFIIPCFAQDYQLGSSEIYHKEDSLFLVWEHHFKVHSDSDLSKYAGIVLDSIFRIKKQRHITGKFIIGDISRKKHLDSLMVEMQPEINIAKESLKRDTSKSRKVILIPADQNKNRNKELDD